MSISRRGFIGSVAALGVTSGVVGGALAWRGRPQHGTVFSAFEDGKGDQFIGGAVLETGEVFGTRVPVRAHGNAVHPQDLDRVLFFARRPGTTAFELQRSTSRVRTLFDTAAGRHLAGHGTFSSDGNYLFTPEHDYENVRGVIAVRNTRTWQIVREIDTHGIDPHELVWLPGQKHLLIANGGIMTHPRSFRRKLNIPTMDPSLCVIDAESGECVEQWRLPDHLLSIRHLSVADDGVAVAGLQYEGDPSQAPCVVAIYRPGSGMTLLDAPVAERMRFRAYVASVTLSAKEDLIAAACPYGNGVACWSLRDARYLGFIPQTEPYGLTSLQDGRVVVSQRDGESAVLAHARDSKPLHLQSRTPIRWDDHWTAIA
jgi:hypothetical protein